MPREKKRKRYQSRSFSSHKKTEERRSKLKRSIKAEVVNEKARVDQIPTFPEAGIYTVLPMPGYTNGQRSGQSFLDDRDLITSSTEEDNDSKLRSRKKGVVKTILDAVEQLITNVDSNDLEQLTSLLSTQEHENIENDNDETLGLLELENLKLLYEYRQRLLKNSVTSTQVAELVGWKNRKTTHDRLKANDIIGIKDKGLFRFPLWQFDPEGDNGILNGLPELLSALEISNFRKLNWLTKPLRAFDGKTPVEVLKQNDHYKIKDLIIEAEGVGVFQ